MKTKLFLPVVALMCATLLLSCNKEDNKPSMSIDKTEMSLNSKQVESIIVSPDALGCTFTSDNKYIAAVSAEGKVTGVTVGTTFINVSNSAQQFTAQCKVTVTPLLNLFKEPYLGFGATKSTVKANETRTIVTESAIALGYKGENSNIIAAMYMFDNQGKMTSAGVAFPTSKTESTMEFLAERYIPLGYENGYGIFTSNDQKMGVGITVADASYLLIIYTPVSSKASNATSVQEQMIELMDNYLLQKK